MRKSFKNSFVLYLVVIGFSNGWALNLPIPTRPNAFPLTIQPVKSSLVVWGDNNQLVYSGSNPGRYKYTNIPSNATNISKIEAGSWSYITAILETGKLISWGYAEKGQTTVPDILSNAVQAACGSQVCYVLKSDGTLVQIGGYYSTPDYPIHYLQIPDGLTNVVQVVGGSTYGMALKIDGTVSGWGWISPPDGLTDVVQLAAGYEFGFALKSDGTLTGFGADHDGVMQTPEGLTNVVQVSVGNGRNFVLVLKSDGTVVGWGDNSYGQTSVPPGLTNVVQIAAGSTHALALKSDGSVVAWGSGEGSVVPDGMTNIVQISAGFDLSIALQGNTNVIDFKPIQSRVLESGGSFRLDAISSSGLPVEYSFTGDKISINSNIVSQGCPVERVIGFC